MNPITGLLAALGVLTAVYVAACARTIAALKRTPASASASPATDARFPTPTQMGVGAITNFFDTLGIGSFATTTTLFRWLRMVPDRIIPGTLNAGHTLPTIVQAFIYTAVIPVDVLTLFSMIAAAVAGAWLGAGVVAKWPKRKVQIGMGGALLVAATLMLMTQLGLFPPGSDALGVRGAKLALAVGGNFMLGALMTLGIGLYAPCMILVSLLGMNSTTAFPIMMGSCAFLMPIASARFIKLDKFDPGASLSIMIGGLPATLVAAFLVVSMPLTYVKWLVIVVVTYTAINLLRSSKETK